MSKWHVALLAVLVAGALAYFFYTAQKTSTWTATPAPAEVGRSPSATPASSAEASGGASASVSTTTRPAEPPTRFNSRNYEVNYTISLTIGVAGVAIDMRGWSVEGVGPLGNYSMGELLFDLPPRGPQRLVFKGATEGRAMYVVNCLGSKCEASVEPANYTFLAMFRGGVRREAGACAHLGHRGVLVEEEGPIPAEALAVLLAGLPANGSGSYSSKSCLVDGVPLTTSGEARLYITLYGQNLTLTVRLSAVAVSAGPYNAERYRALLTEVKSAQRSGA
ncbi:MAG: hypothetical protein ABWK05_02100 [Pyrobaculum sp.]